MLYFLEPRYKGIGGRASGLSSRTRSGGATGDVSPPDCLSAAVLFGIELLPGRDREV